MLPQFKPMGKGFTGWNSPISSAQSSAYGSSGLLLGNSRSAPMGAFAPLSDAGGGYAPDAPDAPGAPTGPSGPSGPSSNTGPSGFGFSGLNTADAVGMLGSAAASALGAGGFAGPMGAAAGFAAGNSADKSMGQAIGSGIGFAFGGPIGSGIFGYLGGKLGSGEWGFEGKGQFDPDAPGSKPGWADPDMTNNWGFNDPGFQGPPDGLGLGPMAGVTTEDLAAPWADPDGPGGGDSGGGGDWDDGGSFGSYA